MEFNDKIQNKYKSIQAYFNIIEIYRKDKKYLISLYDNDECILRSEYILLGTYSKLKNFWIWGDESFTLDKIMVKSIKDFRTTLLEKNINNEIKNFIKKNYTVITTREINNIFKVIDTMLKSNIIFQNTNNDIMDIILITKILQNNIK